VLVFESQVLGGLRPRHLRHPQGDPEDTSEFVGYQLPVPPPFAASQTPQ